MAKTTARSTVRSPGPGRPYLAPEGYLALGLWQALRAITAERSVHLLG